MGTKALLCGNRRPGRPEGRHPRRGCKGRAHRTGVFTLCEPGYGKYQDSRTHRCYRRRKCGCGCSKDSAPAGASSVSMYCLETREAMPAAGDEIEEAAREASVSVIPGARRKSLRKTVTGVVFKNVFPFLTNRAVSIRFTMKNSCLPWNAKPHFVAIGQSVRWGELLAGTKAEFNRNGTVKADPRPPQTAEPGYFCVGGMFIPDPNSPLTPSLRERKAAFPYTGLSIRTEPDVIEKFKISSVNWIKIICSWIRKPLITQNGRCPAEKARMGTIISGICEVPLPKSRCARKPDAAWAAALRWWTRTNASAAASAPPNANLTPFI